MKSHLDAPWPGFTGPKRHLASRSLFLLLLLILLSTFPGGVASQERGAEEQPRAGLDRIPLTHLNVYGTVSGDVAEVTVEQTFENHFSERIEAVYVFPLPTDAAVNEMIMVIGDQRIRADLRSREEARQMYEAARDRGQQASLLEQERPNIFTMNVSNIQPGHPIRVLVSYVMQLPYQDGRYHFHHPTVVGPRFIPGTPTGNTGGGMIPDTDLVPDASRITPGILPQGVRTPYEVEFNLDLEAGMPIRDLESPSHELISNWSAENRVRLSLPAEDRQPNRDIIFTYALADEAPEVGLLVHRHEELGGFFTLMLQPPLNPQPEDIRPKEMYFVMDTSGSQSGYPFQIQQAVMRYALQNMNPHDTFQIINFTDSATSLSPRPLTNTRENIDLGLRAVNAFQVGGGTNMIAGVRTALSPAQDPERMRIVLFLTDGYIGNESSVLATVDELLGSSRLFSLGVGRSVNRLILDNMARVGLGIVDYVTINEDATQVVDRFYGRIRNPILTDVTVDWGDLPVHEVIPHRIPDVFTGTPIVLTGRFAGSGSGTVVVRGLQGTREVEFVFDLNLDEDLPPNPALPTIWARRKVDQIESQVYGARSEAVRQQVLELALQFRLVTQYTSFVAIEESIVADASEPMRTVGVPVALPDGMSDEYIGQQMMMAPPTGQQAYNTAEDVQAAPSPLVPARVDTSSSALQDVSRSEGGARTSTSTTRVRSRESGRQATEERPQTARQQEPLSTASDAVYQVLLVHRNLFRNCYREASATQAGITGDIRVRVRLAADGSVEEVTILHNHTDSAALATCLEETLGRLSFAGAVTSAETFEHTFSFPF